MKALIVYDSVYGNTDKIARAIAGALAPSGEVKVLRGGEANPLECESVDLLVVGCLLRGANQRRLFKSSSVKSQQMVSKMSA